MEEIGLQNYNVATGHPLLLIIGEVWDQATRWHAPTDPSRPIHAYTPAEHLLVLAQHFC